VAVLVCALISNDFFGAAQSNVAVIRIPEGLDLAAIVLSAYPVARVAHALIAPRFRRMRVSLASLQNEVVAKLALTPGTGIRVLNLQMSLDEARSGLWVLRQTGDLLFRIHLPLVWTTTTVLPLLLIAGFAVDRPDWQVMLFLAFVYGPAYICGVACVVLITALVTRVIRRFRFGLGESTWRDALLVSITADRQPSFRSALQDVASSAWIACPSPYSARAAFGFCDPLPQVASPQWSPPHLEHVTFSRLRAAAPGSRLRHSRVYQSSEGCAEIVRWVRVLEESGREPPLPSAPQPMGTVATERYSAAHPAEVWTRLLRGIRRRHVVFLPLIAAASLVIAVLMLPMLTVSVPDVAEPRVAEYRSQVVSRGEKYEAKFSDQVVERASPATGFLVLEAPEVIQVIKQGRVVGSSASGRVPLEPGRHLLEFRNDALGFQATRTVQVLSGRTARLPILLPEGTLSINAVPWADVSIDGRALGETPIPALALRAGSHELVFRHPEHGEVRQTVVVKVGEAGRVSVNMLR
jgi:hypothetical protein